MEYMILISQINDKISYINLLDKVKVIFGISEEQADNIVQKLVSSNILMSEEKYQSYNLEGLNLWLKRNWLDALPLHLKTRNISYNDDENTLDDTDKDSYVMDIDESLTIWKEYPLNKHIKLLPPQQLPEDESFDQILLRRRSGQKWKQPSLNLQQLSDILYYANEGNLILRQKMQKKVSGSLVKKNEIFEQLFLSSYSAIETYFIALKVDDMEMGLYHYNLRTHEAVLIKKGDFSNEITEMCIGQISPAQASCVFIFTTIWERYMYRYRHPRAYRNLLINVADFAHQYILLATTLKLSTWLTPALRDEKADELLGVNGYIEAPLYVVAIG